MSRFSSICFIRNPLAGNRRGDVEAVIRGVLSGTGIVFETVCTAYRGHGTVLAREAADEGVGLVVAVGGDGTLNEVGRGLVERETALGLLPLGSGNALARALGISLDPAQACRALLQADVRPMDVGRIGDKIFFSTAGVGLDAEVCWRYNNRSGRRGLLPYVALSVAAFWSYTPKEVEVILDGGATVRTRPAILTVANTAQYGNGVIIAPGARPDDGLLDLCVIEDVGPLRALGHIPRLFTGTVDRMSGVRLFQTRALRIVQPAPGPLQVDGEAVAGDATLDVEALPGAIRFAMSGNREM